MNHLIIVILFVDQTNLFIKNDYVKLSTYFVAILNVPKEALSNKNPT